MLTPEELEAKVEQAVALGADRETVERVVAHGPQSQREIVRAAFTRMSDPNPGRPPVVSTQTAMVASVIEGSEAGFAMHDAVSQSGGPNETLKQSIDTWRQTFAQRPASDFSEDEDIVDFVMRAERDPLFALAAMFYERSLELPPVDGEYDNANNYRLLEERHLSLPLAIRAVYPKTNELEDAKYSMLRSLERTEPKMPGTNTAISAAWRSEMAGTGWDIADALTLEMVPLKGANDFLQFAIAAYKMGVLDAKDIPKGAALHGIVTRRIREHVATLPAKEQGQFLKDLMQAYADQFGVMPTNMNLWMMMEGVADDTYLETLNPNDRLMFIADNVASLLSLVELGIVANLLVPAVRSIRGALPGFDGAGRLLFRSRPKQYANFASGVVRRMSDAEFAQRWGVSKVDVATTQFPKPRAMENLDNVPDDILKFGLEEERLSTIMDLATEQARTLARNVHTTDERIGIITRMRDAAKELMGETLRPALSRMELFEDDLGVRFFNVLGKDATTGFGSLDEAVLVGQKHVPFEELTFYRLSPEGTLVPYKPKVLKAADGTWEAAPGQKGEFFVEFKQDLYFSPLDAMMFNGEPVLAGGFLSRTLGPGGPRNAGIPSGHLNPSIWSKWTNAHLREQSLVSTLDAITAPLFKGFSHNQRLEVNDMLKWGQKVGQEGITDPVTGAVRYAPTVTDLKVNFPNASDKTIAGYIQSRVLFDTLYQLQNDRLYRAWHRSGYKTLSNRDGAFHGKPVELDEAVRLAKDGDLEVLDAATGRARVVRAEEAESLFKENPLIRMDLDMEAEGGGVHRLVLGNKEAGWKLGDLDRQPLKYVPGYYPRVYKDHHYVQISVPTKVDGKAGQHQTISAVAPTRREADRHARMLVDDTGRTAFPGTWDEGLPFSDKVRLLRNKGYDVKVLEDSRLTTIDREALDLQQFQTEGRLFFDNRADRPLVNVYKQEADTVEPINMIHRTSRAVARQVATEELGKQQRAQFFATFGEKIPFLNTMKNASSKDVRDALRLHLKSARGDDFDAAHQAFNWWSHIYSMEGGMAADVSMMRRMAIEGAEWFDYNIGWKYGGKAAREWTIEASRNAHRFDPVWMWKNLAYTFWIKGRPGRQWMLQGGQHMNIIGVDPTYMGKWQMDAKSLLAASWRFQRTLEGDKLFNLKQRHLAAQLGYSEEEFGILLRQFAGMSGELETINIHAFAGGLPKTAAHTPVTTTGRLAQQAASGAMYIPDKAGQYGFEAAEQYNVAASYLMALRRHKQDTGLTDLRRFTTDDWNAVNARAQGFALAMNRTNNANWQYGLLSMPLQFLQYTHKWMLTMMGASKTLRKAGLGNLSFTVPEARKVVAGQMLLWGPHAIGAGALASTILGKAGVDATEEQVQLLTGGIIDYAVNYLVGAITDGDSDLDIAGAMAPGSGWKMTLRSVADAAWGGSLAQWALGPGLDAASQIVRMINTVAVLSGSTIEGMSPEQKMQAIVESVAAGFLGTPSDYLRVKMAHRVGEWTNPSGVGYGSGFEVKMDELIAKGLFGINTKRVRDYHDFNAAYANRIPGIKSDARQAYDNISRIVATWGDGRLSEQHALANINHAMQALNIYGNEDDSFVYLQEFRRLATEDKPGGIDLIERVVNIVATTGEVPDIVYQIMNSSAFTDEEREALAEEVRKAVDFKEARLERERALLDQEQDTVRRLRDRNK
jgi:hypothetical protein